MMTTTQMMQKLQKSKKERCRQTLLSTLQRNGLSDSKQKTPTTSSPKLAADQRRKLPPIHSVLRNEFVEKTVKDDFKNCNKLLHKKSLANTSLPICSDNISVSFPKIVFKSCQKRKRKPSRERNREVQFSSVHAKYKIEHNKRDFSQTEQLKTSNSFNVSTEFKFKNMREFLMEPRTTLPVINEHFNWAGSQEVDAWNYRPFPTTNAIRIPPSLTLSSRQSTSQLSITS